MSAYLLDMLQSCAIGALMLIGALGFGLSVAMPGMDRWDKRFFMCFFAILLVSVGASFAEYIAYGNPSMSLVIRVAAYLDSLFPSVLILMPTAYLLHCCGEDFRKSALFRAVLVLWAVYFVLLAIAQFTTLFYYYTPESQISYGHWYPALILPLATIMALSLAGVIRRRSKLSKKSFYAFLAFLLPLTAALLVQIFTSAFLLLDLSMSVSALSMFIIVVSEQIEKFMRLQKETARQRSKIAVLQMRPHFIHNTMTSIYHLCEQDPKAAQRVTMDFNTYLRRNFNAIAKDEAIPFAEELEHTRAYLAVEQAQFGSKVAVEFDTPHTQFAVPPLTLQPLAENAVKHGMSPDTVPLRILIRTQKTEAGNEIVVEDNGPGFDPAVADNPQTTLANIRQRLAMMCGGTLDIAPREGGGTRVSVSIP